MSSNGGWFQGNNLDRDEARSDAFATFMGIAVVFTIQFAITWVVKYLNEVTWIQAYGISWAGLAGAVVALVVMAVIGG